MYANARGAAWIAAVGLGRIQFGDVPKLVEIKQTYRPRSENRRLYDWQFEMFTQIYKQMAPVYKRMNLSRR